MSCTPQLHLYGHLPENMRKVEAIDASKFASSVDFSSAEVVEATTNKSIWRWALALFLNPINAPQSFHGVDAAAGFILGTNQLPGVRTTRSSGLARDISAGTVLNRSPNVLFRDRKSQVTLMQIKGVGRSRR